MADYPCNFVYHDDTKKLSWDPGEGAEDYEIVYRFKDSNDWKICYTGGIETSCPYELPSCSHTYSKGRLKKSGRWLSYGPEEEITIP